MTPPDEDTYQTWLARMSKTKSEVSITEYLAYLGSEWLRTEFKLNAVDTDVSLKRAVTALANRRGGEVFVGVGDDKTLIGTEVPESQLSDLLAQDGAPPTDWYVTDLRAVIYQPIEIPLQTPGKRVYVLGIRPPGQPVFLWDKPKLRFFIRKGSSTLEGGPLDAFHWMRETRREDILRRCYRELKIHSERIRSWFALYAIPPAQLPYLSKSMEDGSLYDFLSVDDTVFLLGRARGDKSSPGITWVYEDLIGKVQSAIAAAPIAARNQPIENLPGLKNMLGDYTTQLDQQVASFKTYLEGQGIRP